MKKYLLFIVWYVALAYWFIGRPNILSAGVIVEDRGEVLLIRHTYGHRSIWCIPGGGQKRGEDDETTASRELREGLGLRLLLKLLGRVRVTQDFYHIVNTYFVASFNGQTIKPDADEISEYAWWPKHALPTNINVSTREALKLYLS